MILPGPNDGVYLDVMVVYSAISAVNTDQTYYHKRKMYIYTIPNWLLARKMIGSNSIYDNG